MTERLQFLSQLLQNSDSRLRIIGICETLRAKFTLIIMNILTNVDITKDKEQ